MLKITFCNSPYGGHDDPLDVLSPLSQLDELRGQTPDSLPPAEEQDRVRGEGLQRHGYDGDQHLGPEM